MLQLPLRSLSIFGFRLNFTKGKTEAIAFFAGKGSTAASKQLYREGQIANVITGGTVDVLRFVSTYKHLGSISTISRSSTEEVMVRSAIMNEETKRLRKRFLLSKVLPLKLSLIHI